MEKHASRRKAGISFAADFSIFRPARLLWEKVPAILGDEQGVVPGSPSLSPEASSPLTVGLFARLCHAQQSECDRIFSKVRGKRNAFGNR